MVLFLLNESASARPLSRKYYDGCRRPSRDDAIAGNQASCHIMPAHDAGEQGLPVGKFKRHAPAGAKIGDVADCRGNAKGTV
jgi:hypothetical protein